MTTPEQAATSSSSTASSAPGATTTVVATTLGGPGLPPSPPPTEPVVTTGGGSSATGLRADPGCDGAKARVKLSWTPAGSGDQRVAVSARPDGLDSGNYTTSDSLAPSVASYVLEESQPGGVYYWRVLTRRAGSWVASATAQFEGPTCVKF